MNLGNVPASMGSSYAGLCKRGRPGRFRCGDHGVKSMAFSAGGTRLADSSYSAYQMLITQCIASQPEACYPWLKEVHCRGAVPFLYSLSTNLLVRGHSCVSSHTVSSENPCCVCDRPRKRWKVCCHFKGQGFCLGELPDMFSRVHALWRRLSSIALMALCR